MACLREDVQRVPTSSEGTSEGVLQEDQDVHTDAHFAYWHRSSEQQNPDITPENLVKHDICVDADVTRADFDVIHEPSGSNRTVLPGAVHVDGPGLRRPTNQHNIEAGTIVINNAVVVPTDSTDKLCGKKERLIVSVALVIILWALVDTISITFFASESKTNEAIGESEQRTHSHNISQDTKFGHYIKDTIIEANVSRIDDLNSKSSPQGRALSWLMLSDEPYQLENKKVSQKNIIQRYVLTVLYYSLQGEDWKEQINFINSQLNECDWHLFLASKSKHRYYGAFCNDEGLVSILRIGNNNVTGVLPPEIGHLSSLQELDLDNNNITGTLPSSISKISTLRKLFLFKNNLSGSIPTSFRTMQTLGYANFGVNNNLTGYNILCPLFTTGAMIRLQSNCNPPELATSDCKCCTDCCFRENNDNLCCVVDTRSETVECYKAGDDPFRSGWK